MSAQTSQGVAARTVAMEAAPDRKKPGLLDRIADHFRRYWQLWILTAPALFFVGLFAYVPMWGIQLAFREFDPTKGLTGGKFVGFKYFNEFFHNPLFGEIMTNTVRISLWTLVMGFIFPIILALLINQIGSKKIKGFVQTVTYMPHFISVVVIVSMLNIFLSPGSGILGRFFGDESLMGSTSAITAVYWISEVWQHVGWNSIIYLAALAGVDTSLYEARDRCKAAMATAGFAWPVRLQGSRRLARTSSTRFFSMSMTSKRQPAAGKVWKRPSKGGNSRPCMIPTGWVIWT